MEGWYSAHLYLQGASGLRSELRFDGGLADQTRVSVSRNQTATEDTAKRLKQTEGHT